MASSGAAVPALAVVRVDQTGIASARWTFNRTILVVSDASGLLVNSGNPIAILSTGPDSIDLQYVAAVNSGDPWDISVGDPDITFDPPGTLGAQSGNVL
jgi:hypothetical protein